MADVCRLCNEKLEKKEDSALYYCAKCSEKIKRDKRKERLLSIRGKEKPLRLVAR